MCYTSPLINMKGLLYLILILSGFFNLTVKGQNLGFAVKTSPNINLVFSSIDQYINGIIVPNAVTLNIEATSTQWDLYVGTSTTTPGKWDIVSVYSGTGDIPDVNIVEAQFRNASQTSQVSGFFQLSDISSPVYLIGSALAPDVSNSCPAIGTNTSGSYLTDPSCYQFNVDLKVKPGLTNKPGLYTLRIDYILIQDL